MPVYAGDLILVRNIVCHLARKCVIERVSESLCHMLGRRLQENLVFGLDPIHYSRKRIVLDRPDRLIFDKSDDLVVMSYEKLAIQGQITADHVIGDLAARLTDDGI